VSGDPYLRCWLLLCGYGRFRGLAWSKGLGNLAQGEDLHYPFDVALTPTSPVPEPSTGWLFGGAMLAVFLDTQNQIPERRTP